MSSLLLTPLVCPLDNLKRGGLTDSSEATFAFDPNWSSMAQSSECVVNLSSSSESDIHTAYKSIGISDDFFAS